jgi:hypothetical protein
MKWAEKKQTKQGNQMNRKLPSVLRTLTLALFVTSVSGACAQTAPGDFKDEPDKSLAKAHESFVKGDMDKASEQSHKAANYVGKESDKVAADSKEGVKKAGKDTANGVTVGADEVDKWFKGIGEGINEVGQKAVGREECHFAQQHS